MSGTALTGPTPTEMRQAMGCFASGVTVVTGTDTDTDTDAEAGEPVGFACQSFSSVSLDPPLVLFCADHRGRAWPRIRAAGVFTVNVLGEHQTELCNRFGSSRGEKFEGLDWTESPIGTPSLHGVLMRVHAEVHDVVVAGDHDVVIGRVMHLEMPAPERPMLFFRGRFGVEDQHEYTAPDLWGWGDHWG